MNTQYKLYNKLKACKQFNAKGKYDELLLDERDKDLQKHLNAKYVMDYCDVLLDGIQKMERRAGCGQDNGNWVEEKKDNIVVKIEEKDAEVKEVVDLMLDQNSELAVILPIRRGSLKKNLKEIWNVMNL